MAIFHEQEQPLSNFRPDLLQTLNQTLGDIQIAIVLLDKSLQPTNLEPSPQYLIEAAQNIISKILERFQQLTQIVQSDGLESHLSSK